MGTQTVIPYISAIVWSRLKWMWKDERKEKDELEWWEREMGRSLEKSQEIV